MLTLGEYEALAKNAPGAPPLSSTLGAIERQYWRSLTHTAPPPVYGADVLGSLFGGHRARGWNVDKLGSQLLSRIGRIPGVNQAYLYCGMWRSFFALHKGTPSFRRCVPFHRVTASPLGLLAPLRRALTRCSFRSTAFTSSPRSSSAHNPPPSPHAWQRTPTSGARTFSGTAPTRCGTASAQRSLRASRRVLFDVPLHFVRILLTI